MLPHGYSGSVLPPVSLAQYTIVMWYGTLATIPTGWVICDGAGGTPDLRGYFIRGALAGNAGSNVPLGYTSHSHTGTTDVMSGSATIGGTGTTVYRTPGHGHNLDTDTQPNEPPYKRLVFIMKT